MLPSLAVSDIDRNIEFVDSNRSFIGPVKVHWFAQPTNGISHVRVKLGLKSLPAHLRQYVPLFRELFSKIGTKNYSAAEYNDLLLSVTNGVECTIDKFALSEDIQDREEYLFLSVAFLDRNADAAFDLISELLATPNFEGEHLADIIRMESVSKAMNIGANGLQYAQSYANGGLKSHAKSYELLNSDVYFCQVAQEILSTTDPRPILQDLVVNLTEVASFLFRRDNIEFAVHGNDKKFDFIQFKLEMLLNAMKNNNSRFGEVHSSQILEPFTPLYFKTFFKTPMPVNSCVESFVGPCYRSDDYGTGLILAELLTHSHLHPLIREKGGAYGAGCRLNESGLINFYSFRDPAIVRTYENYERTIIDACDGKFSDSEIEEAKLLAF